VIPSADAWLVVAALVATTVAIRASGPILLGGRDLPARAMAVIALLAPALLAALVVTETFADGEALALDERAAGLAGAGGVLALRGGPVLAVTTAAVVTAASRALL
jgi:hypothetical protein